MKKQTCVKYLCAASIFLVSSVAFAQFERIDSMTGQLEIMHFCNEFKSQGDKKTCLEIGQKRLDSLYKKKQNEGVRAKRGGPGEDCGPRGRSDYCRAKAATERQEREDKLAAANEERKREAELKERELEALRVKESERRANLAKCKKSREARLFDLAGTILMSRKAIEISEADIDREKSIGKRTGVLNQQALYDAGRLIEDSNYMLKLAVPEYKALGAEERDLRSIASKNPCPS